MPRHYYDADGNYRGYSLTDRERDEERIAAEQEWSRRRDPGKDARAQSIFNWGCGVSIAIVVLIVAVNAPYQSGGRPDRDNVPLPEVATSQIAPAPSVSPAPITGTVLAVDMQLRTVRLRAQDNAMYTLKIDAATPIYFNNHEYRCSNLQPGDVVRVVYGNGARLRFDVLRDAQAR